MHCYALSGILNHHVTGEALDTLKQFIELSKSAVPSASAMAEAATDHHENE